MTGSVSPSKLDYWDRLFAVFENKWPWILAFTTVAVLILTLLLDWKRPLWNDEVFTVYICSQPTIRDVWNFLLTGVEQLPPLFHVLTRTSVTLFGTQPGAYRIPETLGWLLLSLSLFFFTLRRVTPFYALAAFLFPGATVAYRYASEARPYGLVMGFCGLAMFCWQQAGEHRGRKAALAGLTLSLAAALSCHYFAVFALVPFGVAECLRALQNRRPDFGISAAIVLSLAPLLLFRPLIHASSGFASNFWAKPAWSLLGMFYFDLLGALAMAALVIMALVTAVLLSMQRRRKTQSSFDRRMLIPLSELGLIAGFLFLPVLAFLVGRYITHGFTSRYAVWSICGVAVLFSWGLARAAGSRPVIGLIAAALLLSCWLFNGVWHYRQYSTEDRNEVKIYDFLSKAAGKLPVVVSPPHEFLVLAHRGAVLRRNDQLLYLTDPALAVKYTQSDTADRDLIALKKLHAPIHVEDYRTFVASHSTFLVYETSDPYAWVSKYEKETGRQRELVARTQEGELYLVKTGRSF